MDKKLKNGIVISILITLVMYIAGMVGGASFNPFVWKEEVRGLIASFWVLFLIFANATIFSQEEK